MRKTATTLTALISATVSAYAQGGGAPQQNPLSGFMPLIVIFAIFYFLLIRPQQKKAKEHQGMLNGLKKDDKIITNGGLYGTITAVKGDVLEVKIAENVKVQVSKNAVANMLSGTETSQKSEQPVTPEIIK